ncbi:MAG: hypothetical protein IGQ88_09950 [Gloeomargaritaceae cyanobacterium C42_A2020_066]|nr:hypothetical protein [Gloeomargaritaceae cyanobacterium C42_A2020_066]
MSTPNPSSSEPTPPPPTELAALAHWLSVPESEGEPHVEAPPPPASGLAALAALLENEAFQESTHEESEAGQSVYFWPAELMDDREEELDSAADRPRSAPFPGPDPGTEVALEAEVETPWAALDFPDLLTDTGGESLGETFATPSLILPDEPASSTPVDAIDMGWPSDTPRPAGPVTEAIKTLTQAVIEGNPGNVKGCLEEIGRQYSASEAIRIFLAASRGAID